MKKNLLNILIVILVLIILVLAYFFLFSDANKITSITVNNKNITLFVGEIESIDISVLPEDVSNEEIVWESSDSSIASVSNGKVSGINSGNAIITAKSKNGKVSDTCIVKVIKKEFEKIEIEEDEIELPVGNEKELKVTIIPSKMQNEPLRWESSDESIVKVENGKVKGISNGEATIKAIGGSKEAICNILVITLVESIKLDKETLTIDAGETTIINPTISPDNASNKEIIWQTSDANIAIVDDGKVTGLQEGSASITAITKEGDKKAICEINVIKRNEYTINFTDSKKVVTKKEGETLGELPTPTKKNYKFLGWYTDKTKGVKVTANTIINSNMTLYARWKFDGKLEIHFISSGYYDDAILIRSGEANIFIDGGRGKDKVVPYLQKQGIKTIDYVIGSHTEYDHIDAQADVISKFDVKNVIYPNNIYSCGCSCDMTDVGRVKDALKSKKITAKVQSVPSKLTIGDMTLYFIAPFQIGCNKNNNSFVFILKYGNNKFMFTGDQDGNLHNINQLNSNAQKAGLSNINSDVLKYPHHGNEILDGKFITAVDPKYIVVPNFGASQHPSTAVRNQLNSRGIKLYRQSDSKTGNILITSDGTNIKFAMNA